jgi:hypothetical protein
MSDNDIHGIEHGWSVKTADGHDIGSVEETTDKYILVKSGLINASHHYLPAVTLAHVRPEMNEIGIALSKEEFDAGDWSEPPAEGPRSEGAPLNVESDDEGDRIMGNVPEPERPTEEVSHRV